MPTTIALVSRRVDTEVLARAVKAGALGIHVGSTRTPRRLPGLRETDELKAVFCDVEYLEEVLETLGERPSPVFALSPGVETAALELCVRDPRVGGLVAVFGDTVRGWEITYLSRRLTAVSDPIPHLGEMLGWGSTTRSWTPRTTTEQRQLVQRIESLCLEMGVDRHHAAAASTAAHELTMNAMYDAPVDADGQPRYALDRRAHLELEAHEVPTLRFTLSGDFLALDITDPHGRLPRDRFFAGVLRGQRNMVGNSTELDTTHGGAGLGLHTLFTSGAMLRAELVPSQRTHVSWALDRRVRRRDRRTMSRSLYFLRGSARR